MNSCKARSGLTALRSLSVNRPLALLLVVASGMVCSGCDGIDLSKVVFPMLVALGVGIAGLFAIGLIVLFSAFGGVSSFAGTALFYVLYPAVILANASDSGAHDDIWRPSIRSALRTVAIVAAAFLVDAAIARAINPGSIAFWVTFALVFSLLFQAGGRFLQQEANSLQKSYVRGVWDFPALATEIDDHIKRRNRLNHRAWLYLLFAPVIPVAAVLAGYVGSRHLLQLHIAAAAGLLSVKTIQLIWEATGDLGSDWVTSKDFEKLSDYQLLEVFRVAYKARLLQLFDGVHSIAMTSGYSVVFVFSLANVAVLNRASVLAGGMLVGSIVAVLVLLLLPFYFGHRRMVNRCLRIVASRNKPSAQSIAEFEAQLVEIGPAFPVSPAWRFIVANLGTGSVLTGLSTMLINATLGIPTK